MHWEVLPHSPYSPDLVPRNVHLLGPLKKVLGGKIFRADDEVTFFYETTAGQTNKNSFKGHNGGPREMTAVYRCAGKSRRKEGSAF
jgi:hypothetical protein